jgi:hypothetical protein
MMKYFSLCFFILSHCILCRGESLTDFCSIEEQKNGQPRKCRLADADEMGKQIDELMQNKK